MGDQLPTATVAAVHGAAEYLDREKTVDKVTNYIKQAGENDADLVVLPESFIPGYPYWIWTHTPTEGAPLFHEFFANAVEVPGEATDRIGQAASQAGTYAVIGVTERDGGTLHNTQVFFDDDGDIMGTHRKLQPTHAERTVWGKGDGSDLNVFETPFGTVGGLICWEHTMDLVRYAMTYLGEQIHIAAWPAISAIDHNPHSEIFNNVSEAAARHHALSAQSFVVNVQSCITEETIEKLGLEDSEMASPGGGWSAIVGPDGQIQAGPHTDSEDIIYADIDLSEIVTTKYACDSVGHYARPDVVRLQMNRSRQPVAEEVESPEAFTSQFTQAELETTPDDVDETPDETVEGD